MPELTDSSIPDSGTLLDAGELFSRQPDYLPMSRMNRKLCDTRLEIILSPVVYHTYELDLDCNFQTQRALSRRGAAAEELRVFVVVKTHADAFPGSGLRPPRG